MAFSSHFWSAISSLYFLTFCEEFLTYFLTFPHIFPHLFPHFPHISSLCHAKFPNLATNPGQNLTPCGKLTFDVFLANRFPHFCEEFLTFASESEEFQRSQKVRNSSHSSTVLENCHVCLMRMVNCRLVNVPGNSPRLDPPDGLPGRNTWRFTTRFQDT